VVIHDVLSPRDPPEESQDRWWPERSRQGFRPWLRPSAAVERAFANARWHPALRALGARPGNVVEAVRLGLAPRLTDPALARSSAGHDAEHGVGDLPRRHDREVGLAQRPPRVLSHDLALGHA